MHPDGRARLARAEILGDQAERLGGEVFDARRAQLLDDVHQVVSRVVRIHFKQ
ncbi:hypothetical protein AKJ08_0506 [Vulgatibacter incomptus]|uniref:Uncharacterized protein n=1 Tax=Vulgatibacter incomptus TaxID=1391653 RepID=A0A0K1PAH9_9BACT|nr:hypothetical protein AKJ08_0506 [Vulgatibacter incomptus]